MENMNDLVGKAVNGHKQSLEDIIGSIKDNIYNLSLRMLWNPMDAEDAAQEIIIKVITNLSKFRGESSFSTWVYSIASNYLITTKKRAMEHLNLSFEMMEEGIKEGFTPKTPIEVSDVDRGLLSEELKVSCTHAMLLCLDREHRMIYILSAMFGVNSKEGALIMNKTPEAYRQRLSRAREKMRNFMEGNCGLTNDNKTCNCKKRVEIAIENHRIDPKQLLFVNRPLSKDNRVTACKNEMEQLDKIASVFLSNPYYLAPQKILEQIKKIVSSDSLQLLERGRQSL